MKVSKAIASTVIAVSLCASAQARELRVAAAAPESSPWGKSLVAFADKVSELSSGELTLKLFHASQLGDEQTTVRQVARGRIDLGVFSNTAASLVLPEFGLLASPYAFDSAAQADCVADKHLLETFGEGFDKAGVRPLAFVEVGQQIIFSTEPLLTPADLKGVKIRTAPTKTDTLYISAAGGAPVPLGTTDTMPALKTGNVSAATWPTVYGIAVGYQKVAPHVTVSNHVHQIGATLISARTWKSLSEQERGWLTEAAVVYRGLRKGVRGAEAALLGKIEQGGASVYRLDEAQQQAWREHVPAAQERILAELGGDAEAAWSAISAAKQDCAAQ